MTLFSTLLLFVAVISFVAGAIILTPLGIVILAFAIYSWEELYPILLRIGRWSAQLRNFLPVLFIAVVIFLFILVIGVSLYGTLGFTSISILLFIWFFLMWLFLFGLAALPVLLAIAIWVVEGSQWLWPRYRGLFWQTVPLLNEEGESAVSNRPKVKTNHVSKNSVESKRGEKTKKSISPSKEKPVAGGDSSLGDAEKQKRSEGSKPYKKKKKGSAAARKKPGLVFRVLGTFGMIERAESPVSEKQEVQAGRASKDAGGSKQVKKRKKKKKSIAPEKEKPWVEGNSIMGYPGRLISGVLSMLHLRKKQ